MITVERLPDNEYDTLMSIEEGYVPDPQASIVVVAKFQGDIIGRMMLIGVKHIEAAWINERFRSGTLLERLTAEMEKHARNSGIKTVFVYSQTNEMDGYIERLGYERSPLRVFRKEL